MGRADVGHGAHVLLVAFIHAGTAVAVLADIGLRGVIGAAAAPLGQVAEVEVGHQVGGVPGGVGIGCVVRRADGLGGIGRVVGRQRVPLVDLAVEEVGLVLKVGLAAVVQVGVHEGVGHAVGGLHHGGVDALVGIVAAAAAVGIAYVHGVRGVGLLGAQLDGGTHFALHPAGDVVAAVEGVDGVGAVHGDVGVAADVGHTAAAHHIALDDGGVSGFGERRMVHLGGEFEVDAVLLHHTVGVGDGVVDPAAAGTGIGHAGAAHAELAAHGGGVHPAQGAARDAEPAAGHGDGLVLLLRHAVLAVEGGTVPVVVAAGGIDTGAAVARVDALAVVAVHTVAVDFLYVLVVALPDGHTAGGNGELGRGQELVAEFEGVPVGSEVRQTLAGGEVDALLVVVHPDGQVHRALAGGTPRGIATGAHDGNGVAIGVHIVGTAHTGFRTRIGVARHAPHAVLRVGLVARGVVHDPVVGLVALTVTVGDVRDGGADIPVEELGIVGRRGSHLHLLHTQRVARADEVVAVVAPLLVVVARQTRAAPHAVAVEVVGIDVDNTGIVGIGLDVEGKIVLTHMCVQVDRSLVVDLRTIAAASQQHCGLVRTLLGAFKPLEESVAEGVVQRGALARNLFVALSVHIHRQRHHGNERQQGQRLDKGSMG